MCWQVLMMLLLLGCVHGIHLKSIEDEQYEALVSQQQSFQQQINSLNEEISQFEKNTLKTPNQDSYIKLLEQSINNQRNALYEASKSLRMDLTVPSDNCQILTEQKRQQLEEKAQKLSNEIKQLEGLVKKVPEYEETIYIQNQIKKDQDYIESIKTIIQLKCQTHYIQSPTVFQTNLLADKWLLGTLQMNQIIDQYVGRAKEQSNITNCQLQTPYFNGQKCMQCPAQSPYFDISAGKCTTCSGEFGVNAKIKKCVPLKRNSNYVDGQNYILQPLKYIPAPDKSLKDCPKERPFFNGTFCQSCPLPSSYWNISGTTCQQCEEGKIFNVNLKECVVREENKLTILVGSDTKWVTNDGNVSRVLNERLQILEENKTSHKYALCPQLKPYYDDISCVACNDEFSLDSLRCVSAPEGYKFDRNVRKYLKPLSPSKQTDPNAPSYISLEKLTDSSIENCNSTHPYYDSIECINCAFPFPIFNYDTKECVDCDPVEVYNASSHKCQTRTWIYAIGNEDKLMATYNYTYDDYQQQISQAIENNPQYLPIKCLQEDEYAAIEKCIPCKQEEYFNMKTKSCVDCDGQYDNQTLICIQSVKYLTNLQQAPFVVVEDYKKEVEKVKQLKQEHYRWEYCPQEKPYASGDMLICMTCPQQQPVFNYTSKACSKCQGETIFSNKSHTCQTVRYQTLLPSRLLIEKPNTIQEYKDKLKLEAEKYEVKDCPEDKPFSFRGEQCFNCDSLTQNLYNITDQLCTECPPDTVYLQKIYQCRAKYYITDVDAKGILMVGDHTIDALLQEQVEIIDSGGLYQNCSGDKPYGSENACIDCPQSDSYFSLQSKTCEQCPLDTGYWEASMRCVDVVKATNLDGDVRFIFNGDPYEEIRYDIEQKQQYAPIQYCPYEQPYAVDGNCQGCQDPDPLFNLNQYYCTHCDQGYVHDRNTHSCEKLYKTINLEMMYYYIVNSTTALDVVRKNVDEMKKKYHTEDCPEDQPYTTDNQNCFNCQQGQYFLIDTMKCVECDNFMKENHTCPPKKDRYPNFENYRWITNNQSPDYVYNKVKQLRDVSGSTECPSFYNWDKKQCIDCQSYEYFNYETFQCEQCQSPAQFDINSHHCTQPESKGQHYTNLEDAYSPNLLYGGLTIGELKSQLEALKQQYPNAQQCPRQTPYFDGIHCINCPSYKKYFNLRYDLCQVCLYGEKLDAGSHNCLDSGGNPVFNEPRAELVYPFLFGNS